MLRRLGALALAVVPTGCMALPVATPPMTVTVSAAAAPGQSLPAEAEIDSDSNGGGAIIVGRAAARPLAIVEDLEERTFGMSLGYVTEIPADQELFDYTRHGGFVGLTHYPWTTPFGGGSWYGRLGVSAMPELLVLQQSGEIGGGMTFSADLELFSYGTGSFAEFSSDAAYVGGVIGEGGVGLSLSGGVRGIGRLRYWVFGAGVLVRLPATGGLLLVPIHELFD